MTFSIVAHCRRTGEYGVCVATYSPNVGARCPVVVPRKGAASIQAVASPQLIALAVKLLQADLPANTICGELLAGDTWPQLRQLAVVDSAGQAYAVTGARNPQWAGHHLGEGFVCAGNVLAGKQVVEAMAQVFLASASETLAERLVRAVEAGRDAGGQPEGQNSSALLVYGEHSFPIVDLRVDLHDAPEAELRRLWDWYAPMVPYYVRRAYTPEVPRWWRWRVEHVPGWQPRHLAKKT